MVGRPAVLPPDALEKERERREAAERELGEVRVELAETRGTLAAKVETIDTLRAERDRLLAEVVDLRRPWIARVVGQVRDAMRPKQG